MCRYVSCVGDPVAIADLAYWPTNSLIHQASQAMKSRTRINAHGFGAGWCGPENDPEPAVFKDVTPAWNGANVRLLSTRAAHGFDPVSRANCHPFQHGHLVVDAQR